MTEKPATAPDKGIKRSLARNLLREEQVHAAGDASNTKPLPTF